MIVNLTPFRGPSADVGSAYEMGFMRALGRPIFAYTNDARPFLDRVAAFCGGALRVRPTGEHEDPDGMAIEPFELHDSLMLTGGVIASGGCIVEDRPSRRTLHVTRCLRALRRACRGGIAPAGGHDWKRLPPISTCPGHRRRSGAQTG